MDAAGRAARAAGAGNAVPDRRRTREGRSAGDPRAGARPADAARRDHRASYTATYGVTSALVPRAQGRRMLRPAEAATPSPASVALAENI